MRDQIRLLRTRIAPAERAHQRRCSWGLGPGQNLSTIRLGHSIRMVPDRVPARSGGLRRGLAGPGIALGMLLGHAGGLSSVLPRTWVQVLAAQGLLGGELGMRVVAWPVCGVSRPLHRACARTQHELAGQTKKARGLRGVLPPPFLPENLFWSPLNASLFSSDSIGYVPELSGYSVCSLTQVE